MNSCPDKCSCGCTKFNKQHIKYHPDDQTCEVEYDLFCNNCGIYLGSFIWGGWDDSLIWNAGKLPKNDIWNT